MENVEITVRPKTEADTNFILASWLKSYYHNSYFCKRIREKVYYKFHHMVVTRLLESPDTKVLIAADQLDPSVILGYLVYSQIQPMPVIHYTYVKGAFRQLGIGKVLMKVSEIDTDNAYFSHWTFDCDDLIKKYPNLTYNPYMI